MITFRKNADVQNNCTMLEKKSPFLELSIQDAGTAYSCSGFPFRISSVSSIAQRFKSLCDFMTKLSDITGQITQVVYY